MNEIPIYSADLIKMLDEHYPEKCPDLSMTDREIWFYVGQRTLVRHLVTRLEQQLNERDDLLEL